MPSADAAANLPVPGVVGVGTAVCAPTLRRWRPFTAETRLRNARQLQCVRENGTQETGRYLLVRAIASSPDGHPRLAIVISRRFSGKAVIRNRARRLLREAYRQLFPALRPAWILIVPRQAIKGRMFQDVQPEVRQLFRRAGLLAAAASAVPVNTGGPAA